MPQFDLTVRLAGENGEGLLSVGDQLAVTLSRIGMKVYTFQNLPAEIKGGASMAQIRMSESPVLSPGDHLDILEVWNQENYDLHIGETTPDTVVLYDPNETSPDDRAPTRCYPIPIDQIAKEEVQAIKSKNVVAWAILLAVLGVGESVALEQFHRSRWARRKASLDANLKAIDAGYRYGAQLVAESGLNFNLPVRQLEDHEHQMIVTGNTAIGLGALAAGLRYYAGYPITPASDIMEFLAKQLPRFGGVIVQTEDEIAALTSVIGASFAGRKAMTATSGPGLSLMVEALGLAAMQEIPLVVVDAQRGGPSTGMPTKPEQSDLQLAVYGSHGESPRIVLAPTDVADCYYTTIKAFNLAEKYQSPVILLSDQHLSHRAESIPAFDTVNLEIVDRMLPDVADSNGSLQSALLPNGHIAPDPSGNGHESNGGGGSDHETGVYQRYAFTGSGVSPMAIPGRHDMPYVATGLEHDEHAHIDYSPRMHVLMTEKRFKKIGSVADEPDLVNEFGRKDADLGVIAWGSTQGPLLEAMRRLAARGLHVQALVPKLLSPLPDGAIEAFLERTRRVVVIELNYDGQLAQMIQGRYCRRVGRMNKYCGLPFRAGEIEAFIEGEIQNGPG